MTEGATNPGPGFAMRRVFTCTLLDIAASRGDEARTLSDGWILRFLRRGQVRHAWGFNLELNSSAAHLLATDKSGASESMIAAGVACVPHEVFLHPRLGEYAPQEGHWDRARAAFDRWQRRVVVKDNTGTGGVGVYRAETARALEAAFLRLFQRVHAVSISPFIEIDSEVRFIWLDEECLLAFEKRRPTLTGDGVRTVAELARMNGFEPDADAGGNQNEVLPAGATTLISWRHNLGQGAKAVSLDARAHPAFELSRRALVALNLRFASIDVVQSGGSWMVLEANSGVMLESVARQWGDGAAHARRIYERAYDAMWTASTAGRSQV